MSAKKWSQLQRRVPAVEVLRRVWLQQYVDEDDRIRWRTADELPPVGARYDSPYDTDAHFAVKRQTSWTGYKVHVAETCEREPYLITHVETTPAHSADTDLAAPIQDALVSKGLPHAEHLLDAGHVDADLIVGSKATQGIDVIGPVRPDLSWQRRRPTASTAPTSPSSGRPVGRRVHGARSAPDGSRT